MNGKDTTNPENPLYLDPNFLQSFLQFQQQLSQNQNPSTNLHPQLPQSQNYSQQSSPSIPTQPTTRPTIIPLVSSQQRSQRILFGDNPHFCDEIPSTYSHLENITSPIHEEANESEDENENGNENTEAGDDTQGNGKTTWSYVEDEALISSFMRVASDATVGTNQSKFRMWNKIKEIFDEAKAANSSQFNDQSIPMLSGRFRRISKGVMKWVACYEKAYRQKSSGMNERDIMRNARILHKTPFRLEKQWEILRAYNKFEEILGEYTKKFKDHDSMPTTPSNAISKRTEDEDSGPSKRPMGTKAAKRNKGKTKVVNEDSDMIEISERLDKNYDIELKKLERKEEEQKFRLSLFEQEKKRFELDNMKYELDLKKLEEEINRSEMEKANIVWNRKMNMYQTLLQTATLTPAEEAMKANLWNDLSEFL